MKFLKISILLMSFVTNSSFAAKVVITGDSTVASYAGEKLGWGSPIGNYFVSGTEVQNLAKGGRSSKTFISEGLWKNAVAQKGNFVFIQFGHNDQGKGHTTASGTFKSNLRKMISDVKKNKGIPVIVSSPTRLRFVNPSSMTSATMTSELAPFANAAREVATSEGVPFINLYEASRKKYIQLGENSSLSYFVKGDRTHTNAKGANLLASLVAQEMKKNSRLKALVK